MSDNLNIDLKDNDGGFNCGKPAGYIEDFNSLPDNIKDLQTSDIKARSVILTWTAPNPGHTAIKSYKLKFISILTLEITVGNEDY